MTQESYASSSLKRALEAKLSKAESYPLRIPSANHKNSASCHDSAQSGRIPEGIFEITNKSGSQSWFPSCLVVQPRKIKYLSLFVFFLSLAAVFFFVRKRQLLKRVLTAIYRLLFRILTRGKFAGN
jgi:hypothetical protein